MRDLVPFFRKKEYYTIFYDIKKDTFVQLPHRKPNIILYVALFLILLRIVPYIVQFYDHYDHLLIKLLIIAILVGINLYASSELYVRYYEHHNAREMFLTSIPIEEPFVKGKKQFRVELIVMLLFLVMSFVSISLFFLFQQFIFVILANLFSFPCFVFLWMRPIKRIQLLRRGEPLREEVDL